MRTTVRICTVVAAIGALSGPGAPAGIATTAPSGAITKCDGTWSVVDSPDFGDVSSALVGVDALASDDIWAVGSHGNFAHERTLAEHWNGNSWKVFRTPNPRKLSTDGNVLNGVDALTPDNVWAVGTHFDNGHTSSEPLIVHWDGDRWKVVPNPPGDLSGGFLRAVTAVAPDNVWAVGARPGVGERDPLVIHWNGTAWKIVRSPNPEGVEGDLLTSIDANSADDIWAVGEANEATTFAIHFDGDKWRRVETIDPPGGHSGLTGVVARGAKDVWAVGALLAPNGSFSEHWDGTKWSMVSMEHRPQFDRVDGVAAVPGSDELWAVGSNQTPDTRYQTFAEHFNGTSWSTSSTPSPGNGDRLIGVTAVGKDVWAVGATATDASSVGHVLIERHC